MGLGSGSVTEISDSELNMRKCSPDMSYYEITPDPFSNMDISKQTQNYTVPQQVKNALQANSDLLKDKNIVKDLLYSEKENYSNLQNPQKMLNTSKEAEVLNENFQKDFDYFRNENTNSQSLSSFTSTPKKTEFPQEEDVSSIKPSENIGLSDSFRKRNKCVNFIEEEAKQDELPFIKGLNSLKQSALSLPNSAPMVSTQNVYTYEQERIFELDGLKGYERTEDNGSNLPLSRLLMANLDNQKQRTKDLEEELTLKEASLTQKTCEFEVVQKRLLRREEQLREAGEQIGKLQLEWQTIQRRLLNTVDAFRKQNNILTKEVDTLQRENDRLLGNAKTLAQDSKQLSDLKVKSEAMKRDLDESRRRSEEILGENARLTQALKASEEKLERLEKDHLPHLAQERDHLQQEAQTLHAKLDHLTLQKDTLESDLKLLQERHSVLLKKAVDEADLKEEAVREKMKVSEALERWKAEGELLERELNSHYQKQLENIISKKTQEMKVEFESSLKEAKQKWKEEVEYLRASHAREKEELQKRHEEACEERRRRVEEELSRRTSEWSSLRRENEILRSQREAILTAISSAPPSVRNEAPLATAPPPPPFPPHPTPTSSVGPPQREEQYHGEVCPRLDLPDGTHKPSQTQNYLRETQLVRMQRLEPYSMQTPQYHQEGETRLSPPPSLDGHDRKGYIGVGPGGGVRPLVTSTSLSSLSEGESVASSKASDGPSTVRQNKPFVRARNKRQASSPSSNGNAHKHGHAQLSHAYPVTAVRRFEGRKLVTASEIVGSCASSTSLNPSTSSAASSSRRKKVLKEVDREMADLVREINSMSEIVVPAGDPDETPRHDTSVEFDSARQTLKKIDRVSNMLASAWQGLNPPNQKEYGNGS